MTSRYCKDCRYFVAVGSTCENPKLRDFVNGMPRSARDVRCRPGRNDPFACGYEGQYFEEAAEGAREAGVVVGDAARGMRVNPRVGRRSQD